DLAYAKEALADKDEVAIHSVYCDLSSRVAKEDINRGWDALSEPRQRFLAASWLESEVNNGGFSQFFYNKGPDAVKAAQAFLEERSHAGVAGCLQRAIDALPKKLPKTRDQLQDMLDDDVDERLEVISEAFWKLKRPFMPVKVRYAVSHKDEFFERD
ncbi:MAG: DUF4375 domain-containing protein, partial [Phycisphaerales bacterium]